MLAVWREWGLPEILKEASAAGVVLAGVSAGAICWFEQGVTDSWADQLRPLQCMGWLSGSCCPHYDGEVERRPAYHALMLEGRIQAGLCHRRRRGRALQGWKARARSSRNRSIRAHITCRSTPASSERNLSRQSRSRPCAFACDIHRPMIVTRHSSAEDFLAAAQPLLMRAEAENNLILGVAQGIARNPQRLPTRILPPSATVGRCSPAVSILRRTSSSSRAPIASRSRRWRRMCSKPFPKSRV